ncbi:MAG: 16S rRNA (guanine(966)-N(2))-methyltransferase RsmD [Anaerolineaceae bacterium]|nr:16S rRNA (guanine(966)-N(2))-methyltransferase RsmD [Anaerolineaceae bacterium]
MKPLRIISGTAKGMRIAAVPGDTTRPITDRVKESLFNIIGADIRDSRFLDLFGGTGSVGIEALSRGAAFCQFLDKCNKAVTVIKENLQHTRLAENANVINTDAFRYLQVKVAEPFDYIYIAPPQYKQMWIDAIKYIDENPHWLVEDAWVIVQIHPIEYKELAFKNLEQIEERKYGSTLLIFYERKAT